MKNVTHGCQNALATKIYLIITFLLKYNIINIIFHAFDING